ncbi:MAG: DUF4383 domain-containing protein [Rhabdochlamydiaceae bacterium]
MLRQCSKIFGVLMILIGVLGFVPGITEKEMLLGMFKVHALSNFIHLITGLLAYFVSRMGVNPTRLVFQILGVFYAIFAVLGFAHPHKHIFKMMAHNMADTWLHVVVALFCIFMGFIYKNK